MHTVHPLHKRDGVAEISLSSPAGEDCREGAVYLKLEKREVEFSLLLSDEMRARPFYLIKSGNFDELGGGEIHDSTASAVEKEGSTIVFNEKGERKEGD